MKKWIPFFVLIGLTMSISAQEGDILWEDKFDDADSAAVYEVGWFYYGESDGLFGAIVQQREGALYMQQGSFSDMLGAVVAGTNGVPALETDENGELTEDVKQDLIMNDFSNPNQVGQFQINFRNITSSWFIAPTRMLQDDDLTDSDPRESPSYLIYFSPLESAVGLAKTPEEPMAMLDPSKYIFLADLSAFTFEPDTFYWIKYYLNQGDYKLKIWPGDETAEPDAWLIEAQDPEPRVSGMFTYFALLSPDPTATDEVLIDNITLREVADDVAVGKHLLPAPANFELSQNYPNPFNPSTELVYSLAKSGAMSLSIYNQNGRLIKTLVNGFQQPGEYRVVWNGQNENGQTQPSGLYYARAAGEGLAKTIKMVLLR